MPPIGCPESMCRRRYERNRFAVTSQMTSSAASPEFYPSDFHEPRFGKAGDQVAEYAVHRVKQSKIKQYEN